MLYNLIAYFVLVTFLGLGVWLIGDCWFSCVVHWKRDGQTFWRDQIIRVLWGVGGLFLFLGSAYLIFWGFL